MPSSALLCALQGRLIVSCQAPAGDPFAAPELLAHFARTAVSGGAAAIRAEGPETVRAIKAAVTVPVIGIRKRTMPDGRILITPTDDDARELVAAGADVVALDCTNRGRQHGAFARIRFIQNELGVPAWADIATVEEALVATAAGADAVLSTLRGYTEETAAIDTFEESFIAALVRAVAVPVVAEGRIATPADAAAALAAGAFAVVVGTAITRPEEITRRFAASLTGVAPDPASVIVGLDLGGTQIKSGFANGDGKLHHTATTPTPARLGRAALLAALTDIARARLGEARALGLTPAAVGIATAGWVNPDTGRVLYATDNLPGWTGTEIAHELETTLAVPVAVENDGHALALAERAHGAGRESDNFVCVTLGTGVGGGSFVGGRINRGAHHFANAIGHIVIERNGRPCTCGRRGCFEAYASSQALLEYAGGAWSSADEVIAAANAGEEKALRAVQLYADWIGAGCITLVNLLDPDCIILSGGLAQNNPILPQRIEAQLHPPGRVREPRCTRIVCSQLGYFGGVLGAVVAARRVARRSDYTSLQPSSLKAFSATATVLPS